MIKAVIFDWGGVVAPNPNGGWLNILAEMLNTSVEDILPHWHAAEYEKFSSGLISEETFWKQFETSFGKPLPKDVGRVWTEGSALEPWSNMIDFINKLRRQGIVTAVLSNTVKPLSSQLRQKALYDGFQAVVLSDEVGVSKPNASIYMLVLDQLKIEPENCLYVDDLQKNLVPAEKLGMKTILAVTPFQVIKDIELAVEG